MGKRQAGTSCWSCEDTRCCCSERSRAASKERFELELTKELTCEDPQEEMCFDSGIKKKIKSKKVCPNGEKHEVVAFEGFKRWYNITILRCKKCKTRIKRVWNWHGKSIQDILNADDITPE